MRTAVTAMLVGLAAVQGALLRGDPVATDVNTPVDIRSEVAAVVDSGCDGVQCGHKPAMVERGHFAHHAYLSKLADRSFRVDYYYCPNPTNAMMLCLYYHFCLFVPLPARRLTLLCHLFNSACNRYPGGSQGER